jgi:hypothetical protein
MSGHIKDLTGLRFGSLTAVEPTHKGPDGTVFWNFLCICGKQHVVRGNTAKHQASKGDPEIPSCGCVELRRKTKHGFRHLNNTHPAYRSYRGMMSRCYDPQVPEYRWYGAKGVIVCDTWKGHPGVFVEWSLANGWAPRLHIDKDILCNALKIEPHFYSPATCQWVTAKVNVGFATNRDNFGKHPNVRLSHADVEEILRLYYSGEIRNHSEISRKYSIDPSSVSRLIRLSKKADLTTGKTD